MYRLNNDIPPFIDILDKSVQMMPDDYSEELIFLDISYLKTFNSNALAYALNLTSYEHRKEVEDIFLDSCLSMVLQTNSTIGSHELTEVIIDLITDILTEKCFNIPTMFNKVVMTNRLILYVDVLRNNIERSLNIFGLNKMKRICHLNFNRIDDANFYSVKDFTSLTSTDTMSSHSLCLKIYRRIDKS